MAFVEVRDVRLFDTGSGGDPPILFCTAQGAIPTIGVSVRGLASVSFLGSRVFVSRRAC